MATEIERKFLVKGVEWRQPDAVRYCQGYLNQGKERTVRVRIAGEHAFITIKGITQGISRAEFEYAIPVADAEQLLALCHQPLVNKMRHIVVFNGTRWEVDEFLAENAGLVVAEVELQSENQLFEHPDRLGQEVTDDPRYFNSNLAATPYSSWPEQAGT